MIRYVLHRLLLVVPTLFGIMTINFLIVQAAPGGPVEQAIAELTGDATATTSALAGGSAGELASGELSDHGASAYRGSRGLDPDMIADLEQQFGFDKPPHERFAKMMWSYLRFDFGTSFFQDASVVDIVVSKLPVSVSLGLWTILIVYAISIPLGIRKAVHDGTKFDVWSSGAIFVGYAVPGFLFAILFVILFAGGSFFRLFPLRGLTSDNWDQLGILQRAADYLWHVSLPVASIALGGFATLTMLTKNSFLEEIGKQYVLTARAKGLTERRVLLGHVFRNAMLVVISGFPQAFLAVFFTGSLLIEVIFSLDGLGRLGYDAVMRRDYPIVFGTMYVFSLLGLLMNLASDLTYTLVDPRIDFESNEA
ncbi:MAG: microcin C ABC transporter permease YejB [Myxococcales bacterium]|nr:microcin C ABC transporter permease YejB [Myxococcales bacterium]MDD9970807.1 microcin C ABC transporter permease YejB [Myxococcales bacterium]